MFEHIETKINKYIKLFVTVYLVACLLVGFVSLLITFNGNIMFGLFVFIYTIISACIVWLLGALSLLFVQLVEESKKQTAILKDIQRKSE